MMLELNCMETAGDKLELTPGTDHLNVCITFKGGEELGVNLDFQSVSVLIQFLQHQYQRKENADKS